MQSSDSRNPVARALYVNAALLAVLIVVLLARSDAPALLPAALGQQQPIAGGAGIFVMPAQFSTNTWGCYLLDVDQMTLCAYQYMPGDKNLRLVAARNFTHDRRLGRFNTVPDPQDVRDLVQAENAPARRMNENLEPVSPEAQD
jgi:hypothetical protein